MTKPVLFTTDFSELSLAALTWARKLADNFDAELHCIFVSDDSPFYWVGVGVGGAAPPSQEELIGQAKMKMDAFRKEHLQGLNNEPVTRVISGKPFVEIVRYAREVEAQMIVIATHGRTGLRHALLGSTTETVVRKSPCPVLVIRNPEIKFEMP